MENVIKTVGQRFPKTDPVSCLLRAGKIIQEAELLAQHPKPRGFIYKAKTWDEYSVWRKKQSNPRLW